MSINFKLWEHNFKKKKNCYRKWSCKSNAKVTQTDLSTELTEEDAELNEFDSLQTQD